MAHPLLLPLLSFVVMISAYLLLSKKQRRSDLRTRLRFEQKTTHTIKTAKPDQKQKKTTKYNFIENLKKRNKKTIQEFRVRFERCGWDPYSAGFLVPIYKVFSLVLFVLIFYLLNVFSGDFSALNPLAKSVIFILMIFIGYRSFDYLIDFKMAQRRNIILRDISMAIDLLVVCVRGGLAFGKALDRIAQELIHIKPELARELTITSAELNILPDRATAYKNLSRRVDSDIIHNLTTSLIQAEEQGVAIGKTLMFLSQESSKQKLIMIETKAAKLPSKLTVPVVLLSLPAILIIILGPPISAIMESDMFN